MTEALRRVVAELEALPDEEQDRIANLLQAHLDREWDALLERPESTIMLDAMAKKALRELHEGRTEELNS